MPGAMDPQYAPSTSPTTASRQLYRAPDQPLDKQYRASETERIEAMENLIEWLPNNIPPGEETTIVHGDYRWTT